MDQTSTPSRTASMTVGAQNDDEDEEADDPHAVQFTRAAHAPIHQTANLDGDEKEGDDSDFEEHAMGTGDGETQRTRVHTEPPVQQPDQRETPPPPPATARTWLPTTTTPGRDMVREYHQPKKMRLPKFKGLNGTIAVSTWLRAVQTETRRQERTLGIRWERDEVYFEMASHLEGEALRWYGNIMSSVIDETDETLARLLRGRYGEQRSDPEVVASLNDRKQMRGEPLVEYAAALREIVADRSIGEEWLVDAFLNGISNTGSLTHIRGRKPQNLDEAVRVATRQVGTFGEGHRVGLEAAMAKQDKAVR